MENFFKRALHQVALASRCDLDFRSWDEQTGCTLPHGLIPSHMYYTHSMPGTMLGTGCTQANQMWTLPWGRARGKKWEKGAPAHPRRRIFPLDAPCGIYSYMDPPERATHIYLSLFNQNTHVLRTQDKARSQGKRGRWPATVPHFSRVVQHSEKTNLLKNLWESNF